MVGHDLDRYRFHYNFLQDRYGSLRDRLSMLANWLFQPLMGTATGDLTAFNALLDWALEEVTQIPESIKGFQIALRETVSEVREIYASIPIDWDNLTEESGKNAFDAYWNRRGSVEKLRALAKQMRELESDLRPVFPDFDLTIDSLERRTLMLQAALEVLANPDEPDIPQELIYWCKTLQPLRFAKSVTESELDRLFEASQHSLAAIRFDAAQTLCGLYDEKSIAIVLGLAHDPDERVRERVIGSLGYINSQRDKKDDEKIVDVLIATLEDTSDKICGEAARCLGMIKNKKAVPALIAALKRPFEEIAYLGWIGAALAEMPDERALEPLIAVLEELRNRPQPSYDIPVHPLGGIKSAIKAIGGKRAEEALKRDWRS